MNPEQRIKAVEDELKILKNEIKNVLLDIREHYLDLENPFSQYPRVTPRQAVETSDGGSQDNLPKDAQTTNDKPETLTEKENREITAHPLPDTRQHISKKIDLLTIIGLTLWVERAVSKLGKAKAEQLIELYESTGRLLPGFREVLTKIARLSDAEGNDVRMDSRDYLSFLRELDTLMSEGSQYEALVLSILCDKEASHR